MLKEELEGAVALLLLTDMPRHWAHTCTSPVQQYSTTDLGRNVNVSLAQSCNGAGYNKFERALSWTFSKQN